MRLLGFLKNLFKRSEKPKYWYILYEDGGVDGGCIHFHNVWYIANVRQSNGRKNFQIVYR